MLLASTTSGEQIQLLSFGENYYVYLFTLGFILHKGERKLCSYLGMIHEGQISHKQNLLTIQFNFNSNVTI